MRAEELLPDDKNAGEFNGVVVRKGSVGSFPVKERDAR